MPLRRTAGLALAAAAVAIGAGGDLFAVARAIDRFYHPLPGATCAKQAPASLIPVANYVLLRDRAEGPGYAFKINQLRHIAALKAFSGAEALSRYRSKLPCGWR